MSKSIDQRIVEMQFDNRQFESGVKTSMNTIDGLKKNLDFSDSVKGLDSLNKSFNSLDVSGISKAMGRLDVSGLNEGIERVKASFSALEVFAITALANISNSLVNLGKKITSQLTIAPLKTGFNEYELKMGSIQTIMAGTGESLETVNDYLEELNVYADKTIYSFKDMTSNIGKFTNAGVKLEDAVAAIKGVSNEAALSGANTQEASRAMYNFAQALSAGYVKLIDWKSIENANMATKSFKETLIQTALELGTVTKAGNGMYKTLDGKVFGATKDFNDSLQHQWMTTDVLISTLKDYADETTDIGKKATKAATQVKTFTQLIDTLKEALGTGWATTWEAIIGDFEEARTLLTGINDVLGNFIGASSDARNALINGWKEKGGRKLAIEALGEAFYNIVDVLSQVKKAFRDIFPPITADNLVEFTRKFKELIEYFKMSDETLDNLRSTLRGAFAIIDIIKVTITRLVKVLSPLIDILKILGSMALSITGFLGDWLVKIDELVRGNKILDDTITTTSDNLKRKFGKSLDLIKDKLSVISDFLSSIKSGIQDLFKDMKKWAKASSFLKGIIDLCKGLLKMLSAIGSVLGSVFSELADKITTAFESFNFDNLFKIVNGGLFSGILLGIKKLIDTLTGSTGKHGAAGIGKSISLILDTARGSLQAYQDQIKSGSLLKIAGAVALLVGSLFLLSTINEDELNNGLMAMTVLLGELVGAVSILNTMTLKNFGGIVKTIGIMTAISISIFTLALALRMIAKLKPKEIAGGIAGIASLMGMLIFTINKLPEGVVIKAAGSMVIFAIAIGLLAGSLKKLGKLKLKEIGKGLLALAGTMTAMIAALKAIDTFGGINPSTAAGILIFAMAIGIMSNALSKLASLSLSQASIGLMSLSVGLTAMVVAINYLPTSTMLRSAIALVIMADAIKIMASAIISMGNMSLKQVGIGLLTLSVGLIALVTALNVMQGTLAGSAALLVASIALTYFAKVVKTLGSMSVGSLIKGLVGMAAGLAIFGIACAALTPVVPVMLAVAGALALFGVGVALVGAGVVALGAGISSLAVGFTALAASIATGGVALVAGLKAIISGFITMIPEMATGLATGIASFIQGIASAIPSIMDSVGKLLSGLLDVIVNYTPKIVSTALTIIVSILNGLAGKMPQIIQAGVNVIVAFLRGVASMLTRVIDAGFDLIVRFINGLANAINKNAPRLGKAAGNLAAALISGLVKGIFGGVGSFVSAMLDVAKSGLNAFKNFFGIHSPSKVFADMGKYLDLGLAEGITKYSNVASDAVKTMSKSTVKPVMDMSDISGSKVQDALNKVGGNTTLFEPVIYSENRTIVEHQFGKLVVEGVNNKGEFVAVADYAVEDMLASLMRRQTRR